MVVSLRLERWQKCIGALMGSCHKGLKAVIPLARDAQVGKAYELRLLRDMASLLRPPMAIEPAGRPIDLGNSASRF